MKTAWLFLPVTLMLVCTAGATQVNQAQKEECVKAHNLARQRHNGAGAVAYDDTLTAGAQAWADHLAANRILAHEAGNYGENVYYYSGTTGGLATCIDAVATWYNEITSYDYTTTKTKDGKPIGHFTQVIWKDSTKIGLGIGTTSYEDQGYQWTATYIVVRYTTPGNFVLMNYGESYEDARVRNYGNNVLVLNSGLPQPLTVFDLGEACIDDAEVSCGMYASWCSFSSVSKFCKDTCNMCPATAKRDESFMDEIERLIERFRNSDPRKDHHAAVRSKHPKDTRVKNDPHAMKTSDDPAPPESYEGVH